MTSWSRSATRTTSYGTVTLSVFILLLSQGLSHPRAWLRRRPETVESLHVMYSLTGDPMYQEWGWNIFSKFEEHTKVPTGGKLAMSI